MAEEIKLVLSADDEGLQAAFGRARAAVGSYEKRVEASRQAALRAALGQEEVLRLQAGGHVKQAKALEQEIALHDRARKLAQEAGITEQKAIAILERRAALQRQIAATQGAAMGAGGSGGAPGLPMAPLTAKHLGDLERARMLNQKVGKSAEQAGRSAGAGAMGFLAFSQAVEDSQYGINGILNNIPMMVMGFGGSMGLAGAISLAAVAATQGFKLIKRMTGEAASDAWEAARVMGAKNYEQALKDVYKAQRDTRREELLMVAVMKERAAQLALIERAVGVNQKRAEGFALEADLVRELRNEENQLNAARERFAKGGQSEWNRAAKKFYEEQARFEADLAAKQKEKISLGRELNLVWENIGRGVSGYVVSVGTAAAEVEKLRERLALQQAQEARSLEQLGAERSDWTAGLRKAEEQNLATTRKRMEETEGLLRAAEAELALQKDLLATTEKTGEQSKKILQSRIDGIKREMEELERKKKLSLEIAKIEADALRRDALRKGSDKGLDIAREAVEKEVAAAEERARRDRSRASFAGEMMALQLEARGRKDQADALRKELEMRAGAKDLAKELGVTEERALALLREKERLAREIANQNERAEGATRRGGIRRAAGDKIQAGGGRIESRGRGAFLGDDLGRSPGLRNAVLESRGKERAASARPADKAAGLMARQNELTERMVKIFEGLGAY